MKSLSHKAFSFVELQVALVILAIGLWGFAGLMRVYTKQADYFEENSLPVSEYYVVSQTNKWMKQLGPPAEMEQTAGHTAWSPNVDSYRIGDYDVTLTSSPSKNFDLKTAIITIEIEEDW